MQDGVSYSWPVGPDERTNKFDSSGQHDKSVQEYEHAPIPVYTCVRRL